MKTIAILLETADTTFSRELVNNEGTMFVVYSLVRGEHRADALVKADVWLVGSALDQDTAQHKALSAEVQWLADALDVELYATDDYGFNSYGTEAA